MKRFYMKRNTGLTMSSKSKIRFMGIKKQGSWGSITKSGNQSAPTNFNNFGTFI